VSIKLEKIYITFFLCLFFFPTQALELNSGFDRSGNVEPFKEIKGRFGYRPGFLIKPSAESKVYWGMSRDGRGIAKYNMVESGEVDGWGLTRWPTEYKDKAISDLYEHRYIYSERSHELYDQYYSANPTTSGSSKAEGCLGEQPLRYGDIDDNGTKEIVLYLSDFNNKSDWIIFSPEKEKIIFSMRWQVRDYYDDMGETPHFQYPSEADQRSYNQGFQV
jgi:hypothetical protein